MLKGNQYTDPMAVAYVQTAAAGTAPPAYVFINPAGSGEYYQVIEVTAIFDVAGGSGAAADVKIVPAATALASGTTCLTATLGLTSGARTSIKGTLAAAKVVAPGSSVGVVTSGTLTALTGLVVQIVLKPLRGNKNRY